MVLVAVLMHISVDFGASTFDLIQWKGGKPFHINTFERAQFPKEKSLTLFKMINKDLLSKQEKIYITGGRSLFFPSKIGGVPLIKVHEAEAIGYGGNYLLQHDLPSKKYQKKESFLVVSMGTGTCMVKVSRQKNGSLHNSHVGGTGVGGGTFLGLCKLLLHQTNIVELKKMFEKGNSGKVDLSVGDIVGKNFGIVPSSSTASNFGKISREIDFSLDDVAAGIINLVGQTIGATAVFAALASDCRLIVLTGKLTTIKNISEVITSVCRMRHIKVVIPQNAEFVSALGAGCLAL